MEEGGNDRGPKKGIELKEDDHDDEREGEEAAGMNMDYIQLFQETSMILLHHQCEQYRRCIQALTQYYMKNFQENQRLRPRVRSQSTDDESDDAGSLPSNGLIVGSAVNIRDNRPLSKETDLSAQLLASRTTCVQCMGCNIKDIAPLFHAVSFPVLTHLNLSFNQIRDFTLSESILPTLSARLTILDLSHNKLSSVDGFAAFQRLKILRLQNNQIETISALQSCVNLEEVWLSSNRIDWIQFAYLSKLEKLRILIKQSNPCDNKPKCNEFLVNILPAIQFIDMEKVESKVNNSMREKDEGEAASKLSVDAKVMITQAKAFLKKRSRKQR